MKKKNAKPVLGLTMGDPAGIGPEICLQALGETAVRKHCVPVLFGDASILRQVAPKQFAVAKYPVVTLSEWAKSKTVTGPMVVDCAAINGSKIAPGKISALCGRAGYIYIEKAIESALAG